MTADEFVSLLEDRLKVDSLRGIGRMFGVSHAAVIYWRDRAVRPSGVTLKLGELLFRGSREVAAGLPGPAKRKRKPPPIDS